MNRVEIMETKFCKIILVIFIDILFLMPIPALFNPLIIDNYLLIERENIEPKSSTGVDLTIIVSDQLLPGVLNVTTDFLASQLGAGIDSVTVKSSGSYLTTQLNTLSTAMEAGSSEYDIIGLDTTWNALFANNGWIIPLDSYLVPGEMDQYESSMVDVCTYNGHYYAYPYFMNLGILYYRRDLMDKNFGVGMWSESDFATWEGLNATANTILNNDTGMLTKDEAELVGYIGQFDNYEGGTVNFLEIAGSAGATDLISGNNVNIAGNADLENTMTFFQKLISPQYTGVQGTPYIIPRTALVMDELSSIMNWVQNNSIFMRQWSFAYEMSNAYGIDFGIAPLPHFAGATNYKTSCVSGSILAIPSFIDSAHKAAAINLTKYLGMDHAQRMELVNTANFPALKSVYYNPPSGFEWINNWTDQIDQTLSGPAEVNYPQISSVISNEFSNILSGGKTVNAGLTSMQIDIENILKPGIFTLTSDADDPDSDGIFSLTWTSSGGADNYSIYEYTHPITQINDSIQILSYQNASTPFLISKTTNGIYFYIIEATNTLGTTLSNYISVNVSLPLPEPFTLQSNANDPDPDGSFSLVWTTSEGANNYSVYVYNNYIININQSLTLLASQDAISPYSISRLINGTYYYIIVAYNEFGSTLSNCIKIVVEIPKKNVPPQKIPGYNMFYLVAILGLMSVYLICKRFRITTDKNLDRETN